MTVITDVCLQDKVGLNYATYMSDLALHQTLQTSQTLSPQMQQSLHLLQAPVLELRTLIQQELSANPVLDEQQPEKEQTSEEEDNWEAELEELQRHDEDWRDYFTQNNHTSYASAEAQERRQFLFDSQVEHETLSDHLVSQLTLTVNNEDVLRVGEEIIGNIDDDGFFKASLEEVAMAAQVNVDVASATLELIQTFHPPGVAAEDLRATLLLQLKHRGKENELEYQIVKNSLSKLGRKHYQELAREYKVPLSRIQEANNYISTLEPRPGAAFAPDQPQNVVQPEAAFVLANGEWTVQLNDEPVPRLRISDTYKDLLGQKSKDNNLRDYLRDKIRAGKFLIKCLHQRQGTITNILTEIANRQSDFLNLGISNLKPLTMNQVADVVGVHETTVSRAIANKYVQTPWGILPIKFFFTSGYQTADGQTLANTSIKDSIAELVSKEDTSKPLSDSEIVKILKEKGIDLARRTVAKYRAELNILPSNLRKQLI
ncbi:MAG: RNA polymerase factor sigma-54 [Verrucomicrobiota bacterium]